MPLKSDRTSYTISSNLKLSMQAKGFDTSVKEGNTYYDGGAAEIHLAIAMLPNGTIRTVANTATFADIVSPDDPAFARMWVEGELGVAIAQIPGVEGSESVFNSPNWTHTITYNGLAKTGTDTKKVDAIAKALKKLIDDLV